MLRMLDGVLTSFNTYLLIDAGKVIEKNGKYKTAHLEKMGVRFESVFANVGNTKSGLKYKSVISIFGMLICH